jgi:hypothetical protein
MFSDAMLDSALSACSRSPAGYFHLPSIRVERQDRKEGSIRADKCQKSGQKRMRLINLVPLRLPLAGDRYCIFKRPVAG